jgi:hypothetical protein
MIELAWIHMEDRNSHSIAFYQLFLYEKDGGGYLIEKRSGAMGKVLDRRIWEKPSREEAEIMFSSIVMRKTDPARKSLRHYRVVLGVFNQI